VCERSQVRILVRTFNFFFLKILFIPFIRDFQTYNFMSDLTAQWARASVEVPKVAVVRESHKLFFESEGKI
jgi:hypothetical protein